MHVSADRVFFIALLLLCFMAQPALAQGYSLPGESNISGKYVASSLFEGPNWALGKKKKPHFLLEAEGLSPPRSTASLSVNLTPTQVSCHGAADGAVTATPSGGTAPYQYSWSNGETTQAITGLAPGSYQVTVTDASSATATASVTITQPAAPLVAEATTYTTPCAWWFDNAAAGYGDATGGTPPYTYFWVTTGQNTRSINPAQAGTYLLRVTDANGCQSEDSVYIPFIPTPPPLQGQASVVSHVSCTDFDDGVARIDVTGGVKPYSYNWSNGGTTPEITDLTAGRYTVTVTDSVGCVVFKEVRIQRAADLYRIDAVVNADVACHGDSTGEVGVAITDGRAPYRYLWSTGDTSAVLRNVPVGFYTVRVTDANGCILSDEARVMQPSALMVSANKLQDASCYGVADGRASVMAMGGVFPYSFQWSSGETSAMATQLLGGDQTVVITDKNGCKDTAGVTIGQPPAIRIAITEDQRISCYGRADGAISVSASDGVAPYSYTWGDGRTATSLSNLSAGSYPITVTDNQGCSMKDTFALKQPDTLVLTVQIDRQASCPGVTDGAATAVVTGGTQPYSYLWSTGATSGSVSGLVINPYQVDVTDANGCADQADFEMEPEDMPPMPDVPVLDTIFAQCDTTISAPTATDGCVGQVTGTTNDPVSYSQFGTYLINWSYTDGSGNDTTQTQVVVVQDTQSPVPDVAELPVLRAECELQVTDIPTAMDYCAGAKTATTNDPLFYDEQGTYQIEWKYDDGHGNVQRQYQTVVIADTTAPVPTLAQLPTLTDPCSVAVSSSPTATDGCDGLLVGQTQDPLSYEASGTYVITWRFTDAQGNVATQDQTVIIADTEAPVPMVAELSTLEAECELTVTQRPTAMDNCAQVVQATTSDPLYYDQQGTFFITWSYRDDSDNVTTQRQKVVIADTRQPEPAMADLPDLIETCEVGIEEKPVAWDECVGEIVATTEDPLYYNEVGEHAITWTYDDGHGNTYTQIQRIRVEDPTAPEPLVPQLPTLYGSCAVDAMAEHLAKDECAGIVTARPEGHTYFNEPGQYRVIWVYDDGNDNVTTQEQWVIIRDEEAPMPRVDSLPTLYGSCEVDADAQHWADDNCSGAILGRPIGPTYFGRQGEYEVVWVFEDEQKNSTTLTQKVVVSDTTAPAPIQGQLPALSGDCFVEVTSVPQALDDCGNVISGETFDPLYYDEVGEYAIAWHYADEVGNETWQVQTITVRDDDAPTFEVPADMVVDTSAVIDASASGLADNCDPQPTLRYVLTGATVAEGVGDASQEDFGLGVTTVTYHATDQQGNVRRDSFTVEVKTTTPTSIAAPEATRFVLYPNPTQGRVFIALGEATAQARLSLHHATGQQVEVPILPQADGYWLDLGQLPQGTYFVKVITGTEQTLQPVIKR